VSAGDAARGTAQQFRGGHRRLRGYLGFWRSGDHPDGSGWRISGRRVAQPV